MDSQEKLLHDFFNRHPDIEKLSDAQLRSVTADVFGCDTDEQKIAFMLLRYGTLNTISSYKDVEGLMDSYTRTLNVEKDVVESVIETCLNAIGKSMPTAVPFPLSQAGRTASFLLQMQKQLSPRINAHNKAEKRQQLDAHPQVPYPPFTFAENIRDYWSGVWNKIIFVPFITHCIVLFGVPSYLLSLLFTHFDKNHWNIYLWCLYGVLCVVALYVGITTFMDQDVSYIKNLRAENYYRQERLQKIIAKKGLTKKAEDTMRAAYTQVRTIKDDANEGYMVSILERAYQEALENVMCYFDDDDRWRYLEIRSGYFGSLESYSDMYKKYYGYKAFDPLKYRTEIFGR